MAAPSPAFSAPLFHEPVFSEGKPSHDPAGFLTKHPSDGPLYDEVHDLLKTQVVAVPPSRAAADEMFSLAAALGQRGPDVVNQITAAGRIVFHAIGDSGATEEGKQYADELSVADQLTMDCNVTDTTNRPAFLLHMGDLVYSFGESQYYYDQFYAPFRDYPAPIFAIPGNHDSFVLPNTPPAQTALAVFSRNFCSQSFVITPEARSLHRTAMTQPGVYYALDVPFVRILCLFSNALEDPGVISTEGGKWPAVTDVQLDFLRAQLTKIKQENYQGAVLIAVHHPPFSYAPPKNHRGTGGSHSGSIEMLAEIDTICAEIGVYPHAFISGHAHNYQRYTRRVTMGGQACEVPFIVCGDGGHHVNPIVRASHGHPADVPHFGIPVDYLDAKPAITTDGLSMEKYNDSGYGYLRVSADKDKIAIGFHLVSDRVTLAQSRFDKITVDIASHKIIAN